MTIRITTGPFLASYAFVFKPRAFADGDPKFQIAMLFPKKDKKTIAAIKAATTAAIKEKWGTKPPKNLKLPLRDGDQEREEPEFEDHMFVNANSSRKPGVVDQDLTMLTNDDEFYSGCTARATVTFFAFDRPESKGVGVGLNNVQKLSDGERLDGGVKAEDDFESVDVDVDLDNLAKG